MESLFEELGIPKKNLKPTSRDDRFIALVHKNWLKTLLKHSKLPDFTEKSKTETWPYTKDDLEESWSKIFVRVFKKRESKVIPLPCIRKNTHEENPLLIPQLMEYIHQTNYKNLWKEASKKYSTSDSNKTKQVTLIDYNEVLREIIVRIYGCSIINTYDSEQTVESVSDFEAHPNIYPCLSGVETLNAIFLIHSPFLEHNLQDCVTFSPSILDKCCTKPLFLIYQILNALKALHERSLTLGEITLSDVYLTEDLWVYIFPQLSSNIHVQEIPKAESHDCRKSGHKFDSTLVCLNCGIRSYDKIQVANESLEKLCELWVNGGISNYTYLMSLNNLSGRRFGDPHCHYVFPWVTDFGSRCGKNWRDLKKSKFRLNKGDRQLDLTYDNPQTQIPHHVSDVLSSITYYVYMSRRTPKSVLCKNVRTVWVPAEYPSSIQRLQEWTPDECIPEFFSDPTVFKSIHDDLDDLEVPSWCSGPEDFVEKHREALESQHVSERLHLWIDLTFGYRLAGHAAVRSKNVCLQLVDGHTNLTTSGVVQLFMHPHPPKATNLPFWGKIPPKVYVQTGKQKRDHSSSSTTISIESCSRSEEEDEDLSSRSPLSLSKLQSRSRSSLNEDPKEKSAKNGQQRSTSLGPKSATFTSHITTKKNTSSLNTGIITLPKEFQPAQALTNLENLHNFFAKTFHTEEGKLYKSEKTSDLDNSEKDFRVIQNAFTNKLFESQINKPKATKSFTFPIDNQNILPFRTKSKFFSEKVKLENQISCNYGEIIVARRVKELQVLGCLILEIFMAKQLRVLQMGWNKDCVQEKQNRIWSASASSVLSQTLSKIGNTNSSNKNQNSSSAWFCSANNSVSSSNKRENYASSVLSSSVNHENYASSALSSSVKHENYASSALPSSVKHENSPSSQFSSCHRHEKSASSGLASSNRHESSLSEFSCHKHEQSASSGLSSTHKHEKSSTSRFSSFEKNETSSHVGCSSGLASSNKHENSSSPQFSSCHKHEKSASSILSSTHKHEKPSTPGLSSSEKNENSSYVGSSSTEGSSFSNKTENSSKIGDSSVSSNKNHNSSCSCDKTGNSSSSGVFSSSAIEKSSCSSSNNMEKSFVPEDYSSNKTETSSNEARHFPEFPFNEASISSKEAGFPSGEAGISSKEAGHSAGLPLNEAGISSKKAGHSAGLALNEARFSLNQTANSSKVAENSSGFPSNKAGISSKEVGFSFKEAEFLSNDSDEAEFPSNDSHEAGISSSKAESPSDAGISSKEADFSSNKAGCPYEAGISSKEAKFSSGEAGISSKEARFPSDAGISSKEAKFSSGEAGISSKEAKFPSDAGISSKKAKFLSDEAGISYKEAGFHSDAGISSKEAGISSNKAGCPHEAGISSNEAGILSKEAGILSKQAGISSEEAGNSSGLPPYEAANSSCNNMENSSSFSSSDKMGDSSSSAFSSDARISSKEAGISSGFPSNKAESPYEAGISSNKSGISSKEAGISSKEAGYSLAFPCNEETNSSSQNMENSSSSSSNKMGNLSSASSSDKMGVSSFCSSNKMEDSSSTAFSSSDKMGLSTSSGISSCSSKTEDSSTLMFSSSSADKIGTSEDPNYSSPKTDDRSSTEFPSSGFSENLSSAGFSSFIKTDLSSAGFSSANNTNDLSSAGFSSSNKTDLSSAGFSSANNTNNLSSAGFSSSNKTDLSSAGFSSANNTENLSSAGFSSSNKTDLSSTGFSPLNKTENLSSTGLSSSNKTGHLASTGFSSSSKTDLSSTGFFSLNKTENPSSAGFSSSNKTENLSSTGFFSSAAQNPNCSANSPSCKPQKSSSNVIEDQNSSANKSSAGSSSEKPQKSSSKIIQVQNSSTNKSLAVSSAESSPCSSSGTPQTSYSTGLPSYIIQAQNSSSYKCSSGPQNSDSAGFPSSHTPSNCSSNTAGKVQNLSSTGFSLSTHQNQSSSVFSSGAHQQENSSGFSSGAHQNQNSSGFSSKTHQNPNCSGFSSGTHQNQNSSAFSSGTHQNRDSSVFSSDTHQNQKSSRFSSGAHRNRISSGFSSSTHQNQNSPGFSSLAHQNNQHSSGFSALAHQNNQNSSGFSSLAHQNNQNSSGFSSNAQQNPNCSGFSSLAHQNPSFSSSRTHNPNCSGFSSHAHQDPKCSGFSSLAHQNPSSSSSRTHNLPSSSSSSGFCLSTDNPSLSSPRFSSYKSAASSSNKSATANNHQSLIKRVKTCLTILASCPQDVPKCVKNLVNLLLQPEKKNLDDFKYPAVTELGLPPPTAHLLLEPLLHQLIPFNENFYALYNLISNLKEFEGVSEELEILYHFDCNGEKCLEYENIERAKILLAQNISECKVRACAKDLEELFDDLSTVKDAEIISLLVPHIRKLIEEPPTSILAAWYLFDPVAKYLGPTKTCEFLLEPILKLYETDSNTAYFIKIVKLYHHSFLLRLIVRFGLRTFLEYFSTPLVEAVGGYRDHNFTLESCLHTHSLKNLTRKTSNLKNIDDVTDLSPADDSSGSEKVSTARKVEQEVEVFHFETEDPVLELEDQPLQSLIEHLELNISADLPFNHSSAEEALDVVNLEQELGLRLSLNLDEVEAQGLSAGLTSPSIPIPCKFKQISCDVGSKRSDEANFGSETAGEDNFQVASRRSEDAFPSRESRSRRNEGSKCPVCASRNRNEDAFSSSQSKRSEDTFLSSQSKRSQDTFKSSESKRSEDTCPVCEVGGKKKSTRSEDTFKSSESMRGEDTCLVCEVGGKKGSKRSENTFKSNESNRSEDTFKSSESRRSEDTCLVCEVGGRKSSTRNEDTFKSRESMRGEDTCLVCEAGDKKRSTRSEDTFKSSESKRREGTFKSSESTRGEDTCLVCENTFKSRASMRSEDTCLVCEVGGRKRSTRNEDTFKSRESTRGEDTCLVCEAGDKKRSTRGEDTFKSSESKRSEGTFKSSESTRGEDTCLVCENTFKSRASMRSEDTCLVCEVGSKKGSKRSEDTCLVCEVGSKKGSKRSEDTFESSESKRGEDTCLVCEVGGKRSEDTCLVCEVGGNKTPKRSEDTFKASESKKSEDTCLVCEVGGNQRSNRSEDTFKSSESKKREDTCLVCEVGGNQRSNRSEDTFKSSESKRCEDACLVCEVGGKKRSTRSEDTFKSSESKRGEDTCLVCEVGSVKRSNRSEDTLKSSESKRREDACLVCEVEGKKNSKRSEDTFKSSESKRGEDTCLVCKVGGKQRSKRSGDTFPCSGYKRSEDSRLVCEVGGKKNSKRSEDTFKSSESKRSEDACLVCDVRSKQRSKRSEDTFPCSDSKRSEDTFLSSQSKRSEDTFKSSQSMRSEDTCLVCEVGSRKRREDTFTTCEVGDKFLACEVGSKKNEDTFPDCDSASKKSCENPLLAAGRSEKDANYEIVSQKSEDKLRNCCNCCKTQRSANDHEKCVTSRGEDFINEHCVPKTLIEGCANPTQTKSAGAYSKNRKSTLDDEVKSSSSFSKLRRNEAKISSMSADSLIWLSHRLGPVLTARYLSRNLLKMLTLCYVGKENLVVHSHLANSEASIDTLDLISIANSRVIGDKNAAKVLECLASIAALYGEQLILLQYLPHMSELIALCKRKLTPNLEGGLISCLALLKHIIPYICDSTLMDQLQDVILKNILHPSIRLLGSTKYAFPNGSMARNVLARKYLDTLYVLSLRMGADMTRTHLAVPALQRFFLIFDKICENSGYYGGTINNEQKSEFQSKENLLKSIEESHFLEVRRDGTIAEWAIGGRPVQISHVRLKDSDSTDSLSPPKLPSSQNSASVSGGEESVGNQALEELQAVFTPELAHTAYIPFLKQIGQPSLESSLKNHSNISNLCQEYEKELKQTITNINNQMNDLLEQQKTNSSNSFNTSSIGSNVALIGNRIDVQEDQDLKNTDILSYISNKMENNVRHLRGNWLAYWEHEIGRSDKDVMFNFKQIKLQTFTGHSQSIKSLHVLDNENSFLSGSRDKTVKLWSLRSLGDGTSVSNCQSTYTSHKKSVLAIAFLDGLRLVASCDTVVHLWDPFMGASVGILESPKNAPVNVLKSQQAPSSLLFAATTEGTLRVIDARICSYIHELKVTINPTVLIRCLAVSPSGNWIATGQASGQITVLDTRNGLVMASWRAHEGELLQIVAFNEDTIISSSLDQSVSVWNVQDGKFKFHMKGCSEPVHCLNLYNNELISGSTANRIGVHTSIDRDASFSNTKLRSDAFKGLLTSMAVLPLNRLLLLGADTGNIHLLC